MTSKPERPPRFTDRSVIVTGASKGIGQALAVAFAREGARVAVNYHSDEEGAEKTRRLMRHIREAHGLREQQDLVMQADVSKAQEVDALFARVDETLDGLDILINNAGIQMEAPAHEADLDAFDKPIAVNLRGPFLCARRAIQRFCDRGNGGVIVNITSVHETIPKPMYAGYSASKGGLQNLNRTLALEYARDQVRVNAVAPGAVVTPINEGWVNDPERRAEVARHIPMGRPAQPEEVTPAVLFLSSDEARYITGQTLFVDGGLTLYPDFRTPWSS